MKMFYAKDPEVNLIKNNYNVRFFSELKPIPVHPFFKSPGILSSTCLTGAFGKIKTGHWDLSIWVNRAKYLSKHTIDTMRDVYPENESNLSIGTELDVLLGGLVVTETVFTLNGVGGFLGIMLTAIFASNTLGIFSGQQTISMGSQLLTQFTGAIAVITYTAVATWAILLLVRRLVGTNRVTGDNEVLGLDLSEHNERGYVL